ncbi:MAG: metal ABC transporter substrate-binding protein [Candidatus Dojkabacteria bacterium]|nr:MAG: metal ABC transporter substrate-binding protein [Candidatus Dojkabacteria bacterium]
MSKLSLLLALVLIIVGAFVVLSNNEQGLQQERTVAASIAPLASLVQSVAGDKIEVVQILPAGSSPHTFSLAVSDKLKIEKAEAVFVIGHELDDWAVEGLSEDKILQVDSGIELKEAEDHEDELEADHDHEGEDPHYWLSLTNAIIMVDNIESQLSKLYPQDKDTFVANAQSLKSELETLRNDAVAKFSQLQNKELVTFHNAFAYFADDLGLEVIATIEEFPGKEPTAAYLKSVGELIQEKNIKVLFKEPQLSDAVIKPLAEDYGAKVLTLDPIGGINGRESYLSMMHYNIDTIFSALSEE